MKDSIKLGWNPVKGQNVLLYKISYTAGTDKQVMDVTIPATNNESATSFEYNVTGLVPTTIYTFNVTAINSWGESIPATLSTAANVDGTFTYKAVNPNLKGPKGEPVVTSFDSKNGLSINAKDLPGDGINYLHILSSTNLKDWTEETVLEYGDAGVALNYNPNVSAKQKFYKVGYNNDSPIPPNPPNGTITYKTMTAAEVINANKDKATSSYNTKDGATFTGYDLKGDGPNFMKIFSSPNLKDGSWKLETVVQYDDNTNVKLSYKPTDLSPAKQFFRAEITNAK